MPSFIELLPFPRSSSSFLRTDSIDDVLLALPGTTRVLKVRLLVSPIRERELALARTILNGLETFVTIGHTTRTVESMFTHFAIEVVLEGGLIAKLERYDTGVCFSIRDVVEKEVEAGSVRIVHSLTLDDVTRFYKDEGSRTYSLLNNCKHFAYHFFSELVYVFPIGNFGKWCRSYEDVWKAKTSSSKVER